MALLAQSDKTSHEELLVAINEAAHHFGNDNTLQEGDVLAIEVECSDMQKTIPNNLSKNRTAGLKHIVFAVMPKDVTAACTLISTLTAQTDLCRLFRPPSG